MGKNSKTKRLDQIKNDPTVKKILNLSKLNGGTKVTPPITCNGIVPQ